MSPAAALSKAEREFIEAHRVARLATADSAGAPHVVPIVYALVGEDLYFVVDEKPKKTRRGLKRLRNIASNPRVAIVIDDYDEDWNRLAYLLIEGLAEEVDAPERFPAVIVALRRRYPQYERMDLSFGRNPLVRIRHHRLHLWSAGSL
jgi:PPOX class probable F420-dependent enzyme